MGQTETQQRTGNGISDAPSTGTTAMVAPAIPRAEFDNLKHGVEELATLVKNKFEREEAERRHKEEIDRMDREDRREFRAQVFGFVKEWGPALLNFAGTAFAFKAGKSAAEKKHAELELEKLRKSKKDDEDDV